jgi:hypothetical protein
MGLLRLFLRLVYSEAVIFEEVKEGNLTKEELEELHLPIGIRHSVIEDPAIFLIMAILVVRLLTLRHFARKTKLQ